MARKKAPQSATPPARDGGIAEHPVFLGDIGGPLNLKDVPYGQGVPLEKMARFCEAAAALYRVEPWDVVESDEHVLLLEAPRWGITRGCVVVVGQMGEAYGVLILRSIDEFLAFRRFGTSMQRWGLRPAAAGWEILSVNYERQVSPDIRPAFKRHGWKMAGAGIYPLLFWTSPSHPLRPVSGDEIDLARSVCEALHLMIGKFEEDLLDGPTEPLSLRVGLDGAEVTLTVPHPDAEDRGLPSWTLDEDEEDDDDFEDDDEFDDDGLEGPFFTPSRPYGLPETPPPPTRVEVRPPRERWRPTAGELPPALTAPCPCGSGARYKKCCMPR